MYRSDILKRVVCRSRNRVLRGGGWINNGQNLRSAYRNYNPPDNRNNNIGFRLAGAYVVSFYRIGRLVLVRSHLTRCISFGVVHHKTKMPWRVSSERRESLPGRRLFIYPQVFNQLTWGEFNG